MATKTTVLLKTKCLIITTIAKNMKKQPTNKMLNKNWASDDTMRKDCSIKKKKKKMVEKLTF